MLRIRYYDYKQSNGTVVNKIDRIIYCCDKMAEWLPLDNDPVLGFTMSGDKLIVEYDSYFEQSEIYDAVKYCPFCATPVQLEKLELIKGE